jgi:hypothetical protein
MRFAARQREPGDPRPRRAGHRRGAHRDGDRALRRDPRVVAYNRYTHDVDRLAVRFETFIEEFSNILQRQG